MVAPTGLCGLYHLRVTIFKETGAQSACRYGLNFMLVGTGGDSLSTVQEATNFAFYMATANSRMQFQNSFVSGPSGTPVPTRFEGNRTKERSRIILDFIHL